MKTATEVAVPQSLTIKWHEIQAWQRDNHYIQQGYRRASNSYKKSLKSLTYLHNESVNIYSHLAGSVAFAITSFVLWSLLARRYSEASMQDVYVLGCFFVGAVGCLGMSGTYHLLTDHSEMVAYWGNKMDYFGIMVLIWGSFIPPVYYGFQCHTELISRYWTMVS